MMVWAVCLDSVPGHLWCLLTLVRHEPLLSGWNMMREQREDAKLAQPSSKWWADR